MVQLFRFLRSWFQRALRSLAFLPLPMMLGAIALGVLLFHLETHTEWSQRLVEWLPARILNTQNTARSVLTVIIGGLITLTVFTFTQMMTLFSQVSNSYSPRLLPVFTSSQALQFTMGAYLSSIILSLIVLLSIRENDAGYVPNVSVLICIALGVACLVLFLYFVTTISNKIQVTNIIESLYERGLAAIESESRREQLSAAPLPADVRDWYAVPSPIGGYRGSIDLDHLAELADRHATEFFVAVARGQYVPEGHPIVHSRREVSEQVAEDILTVVSPAKFRFGDWHLPPVRLLTEIAVRAMSPGINDPGTCLNAIDYLTELFALRMQIDEVPYAHDAEDTVRLYYHPTEFSDLLYFVLAALRTYIHHDPVVLLKTLDMFRQLLQMDRKLDKYRETVVLEVNNLLRDAEANLKNEADLGRINRMAERLREESAADRRIVKIDEEP